MSATRFERAFASSPEQQMGLSVCLVLAWIAVSDGDVSGDEAEAIRSIASKHQLPLHVSLVLESARAGQVKDLQLACELIRRIRGDQRRLFVQMAIGVALADGYLVTGEIHIIRFLADVLNQGGPVLDDIFREMTGHTFPNASDPSTVQWWTKRERANGHDSNRHAGDRSRADSGRQASATHTVDIQRIKDLAILGLDEDADPVAIRDAYRRMAKVHHPDRYMALGPEAVAAAEQTFRRLHAAYERLA